MAGEEDQEIEYSVCYDDGERANWVKRSGKAKVTYANGDSYEGEYNGQGLRHGRGTYTWNTSAMEAYAEEETAPIMRYKGLYVFGKKQGSGHMEYPDGSSFRGQFLWDKRHGLGTYTYPNGDLFSGHWKDGQRHGDGTYVVKADQSQLTGVWVNGKLSTGKWLLANGNVYAGDLKGSGTFTFERSSQTGEFKVEEGDDEDASSSWIGGETMEAPLSINDLTGAQKKGEPEVPSLATVKNLEIGRVSSNGIVEIRIHTPSEEEDAAADSSESTSNLKGLNVELFGEGSNVPDATFSFVDDIDLSSNQCVRLLFGDNANKRPPTTGEENESTVQFLHLICLDTPSKDVKRAEICWTSASGERVWLSRADVDGTSEHRYFRATQETAEEASKEGDDENDDSGAKEEEKSDE